MRLPTLALSLLLVVCVPLSGGDRRASSPSFFHINVPPAVTSTTPANGATDVDPASTVKIRFSEAVNVTGSAFRLECPTGTTVAFAVSPASPATAFVLAPTASLPSGTTCTLTVGASQVTDVDAGQQMTAAYTASFST